MGDPAYVYYQYHILYRVDYPVISYPYPVQILAAFQFLTTGGAGVIRQGDYSRDNALYHFWGQLLNFLSSLLAHYYLVSSHR